MSASPKWHPRRSHRVTGWLGGHIFQWAWSTGWCVSTGRFPSSPLQFIERDRQVAHALAGRMVDADDAELAQPLDAEWIDDVVRLVDEDGLDVVHVGVHRDMIFGN